MLEVEFSDRSSRALEFCSLKQKFQALEYDFLTMFFNGLQHEDEDEYDLVRGSGSRRRAWDDEYVLKRQFSALIPAFDPRPGRTNVNQTQDFSIPPPGKPLMDLTVQKLIV